MLFGPTTFISDFIKIKKKLEQYLELFPTTVFSYFFTSDDFHFFGIVIMPLILKADLWKDFFFFFYYINFLFLARFYTIVPYHKRFLAIKSIFHRHLMSS